MTITRLVHSLFEGHSERLVAEDERHKAREKIINTEWKQKMRKAKSAIAHGETSDNPVYDMAIAMMTSIGDGSYIYGKVSEIERVQKTLSAYDGRIFILSERKLDHPPARSYHVGVADFSLDPQNVRYILGNSVVSRDRAWSQRMTNVSMSPHGLHLNTTGIRGCFFALDQKNFLNNLGSEAVYARGEQPQDIAELFTQHTPYMHEGLLFPNRALDVMMETGTFDNELLQEVKKLVSRNIQKQYSA